ncbi:pre-rRNA-processing protein TSR2 homolog [Sitophilus oryzae]|uniref:Pre-rRNA-processing protein TSR2 homolog n=1 Tax=Sitophilus oryzae TaxID=7048 RepID=A0A6J2Y3Z2_SITOR|nr:pre-rRNA-processing protein TSR2 homolog [Sitophilus oryzae]
MEEPFTKIVSQIFNNWTALRLAVEHSDKSNSKQAATEFLNYMVQFCLYENNVDLESIQDALEDILDEEFETICEDESPKQVANVLFKFLILLKEGKTAECEIEFQKLPTANTQWLNQQSRVQEIRNGDSSSDSDDDISPETPMEDDGWIEVKGRKKR